VPARSPIRSSAAWTADDMADPAMWTVTLSSGERREIVRAARTADERGADPQRLESAQFELEGVEAACDAWVDTLVGGRGFVLVKGFPVEELTPRQVEIAYVGLGLRLGTPVSQNAAGDLLGHVRDEGVPRVDPTVRLYQTKERQDFHTDGADLVGLLCLQKARSGGESRIASAATVYNRMLERRPDLLEVLYEPMYWDRNGEERAGEDPYFSLPVLSDVDGSPRMFFIGWYIRDAQRHPRVPRLTGPQEEALGLIEEIANDPEVYLPMSFEPGDVQILSNAKILHCRESYEDDPEPARRRHLLRLWLAAASFVSVDDVLRGGIPPKVDTAPN
jgi:Taurine catabolism dioxygenase TauD, TfdA family